MIRNFVLDISRREAGKAWVDCFLKRHDISIVLKSTTAIDSSRKRADLAFKYKLYFELLRDKIDQYDIQLRLTYNMDEKGFLIGILSRVKRIFSRSRYETGELKQIIQDGNREWITIIACICADGTALTLSLIYQAVSDNIQDTWLQDFDPNIYQACFTSSPTGWTNSELGLQWLIQVFDRETKQKARKAYRLLIFDGYRSHISMKFIDFCDKNRILLAISASFNSCVTAA